MGRWLHWLLFTIFTLQLVSTAQRQVIDFLGYMWLPIFANFCQILCTILGFFGIYQYRVGYITVYTGWALLWIAWNTFVICFYLEVGFLSRDDDLLNLSTGSRSWWEANGFGCVAEYNKTLADEVAWNKPVSVDGCLVKYYYVETVQAAVQILLALFGFVGCCYAIRFFSKEDDSFATRRRSGVPYGIEFQRHPAAHENPYQRPMTPRKVKRRSTRSKRSQAGTLPPRHAHGHAFITATASATPIASTAAVMSSNRSPPSSSSSYYQNPVTRLMSLNTVADSSTSNELDTCSFSRHQPLPPYTYAGHLNLGYQPSRPVSFHNHNHNHSSSRRPSPIYMNDSETVI